MEVYNKKLSIKLNEYLRDKIKLSFASSLSVIILTIIMTTMYMNLRSKIRKQLDIHFYSSVMIMKKLRH